MSKITIEVSEERYVALKLRLAPLEAFSEDIIKAYELEKDKIKIGDWVKIVDSMSPKIQTTIVKLTSLRGYESKPHYLSYTKLSQTLQDILNKEIT